tara:strand:- start:240 stop:620 length:381 start_codon:yes stop_codon:yes gene_type:complete
MAASFGLNDVFSRTFTAGEDLNAFDAVTLKSDGTVEASDADTDSVLGFCSRDCKSGDDVAVRLIGAPSNNATAAGTVAVGALVYPNAAAGRVGASGSEGTNPVLGVAVTAAASAGDTIVILPVRTA